MKSSLRTSFKLLSVLLFFSVFLISCASRHEKFIVVIGDQNAAVDDSWVSKLKKKMPENRILNFSVPGNTYGFNNLSNEKLNTLHNIEIYLDNALDSSGGRKIDYLFLSLGTNDCKNIFDNELSTVPVYLNDLIRKIKGFPGFKNRPPDIVILSPVPFGPDPFLPARFKGADERVKYLLPFFKDIARQSRCDFIDLYSLFQPDYMKYSLDGFHLNDEGQQIIAGKVYNFISDTP